MNEALRNPKMRTAVKMRANAAQKETTEVEKKGRKASKETRRFQLIEATIDSLAKRGYAETTLADVADGAGLSRGIVNFHFESKVNLLVATLQYMADEYANHWSSALEKAGERPADQLWALVAADFDRKICTKRKLAAWCAFWGEAKSRPTYQVFCGARDVKYQEAAVSICAALKDEGDYSYAPEPMARGLTSMLEGLWLRLMIEDGLTREKAHEAAIEAIVTMFPKHVTRNGAK